MREARFKVIGHNDRVLAIKDIGPWDEYLTVTNDIENVVRRLYASGDLVHGQSLNVVDSEGDCDTVIHEHGEFVSFALTLKRIVPEDIAR